MGRLPFIKDSEYDFMVPTLKGSDTSDLKVFYVSGEESVDQICARAKRLGVEKSDRIFLAAQTQIEKVVSIIKEMKPNWK